MKGMEYTSEDGEGNNYIIKSEYGELNNDKQELILMKSVTATINFTNSESIRIFADEAIYNSVNYNTAFSKNVLVTHGEHTINSNNLDIMFEKNLISISNEVIYKNLNTKLAADMVEIDLVTKSSKIFMNNKLDKVNIISLN
jgi:lipopolysaccharide export system protein LptA